MQEGALAKVAACAQVCCHVLEALRAPLKLDRAEEDDGRVAAGAATPLLVQRWCASVDVARGHLRHLLGAADEARACLESFLPPLATLAATTAK